MGYWQDVLAENPNMLSGSLNNSGPFRWWLYDSLRDDQPMDAFVTELIRMEGSSNNGGPAGFAEAGQNDAPMAELAPDQSPAWRKLGVSLLQKLVLEHLLAKKCPGERKLQYVHLLSEATDAIAQKECPLACLVPPAQIVDVQEIASTLEKMPPKSTYFYPKLLSGLVFHSVE